MAIKSLTTQKFSSLDNTANFLANRTKNTFYLKELNGIEIQTDQVLGSFDVIETDEDLVKRMIDVEEKTFPLTRYVWGHLAGFLSIPNKVWDYWQLMRELNSEDFITCQDHESDVMVKLFNHRLEQIQTTRKTDIYLTTFNDGFGDFPRVVHSTKYYPVPDVAALEKTMTRFDTINRENDNKNYEFQSAYVTPYRSEFNFINPLTSTKNSPKVGDIIVSGISMTTSECKNASEKYQAYIERLECENGMTSRVADRTLSVRHYAKDYDAKVDKAFEAVIKVENDFSMKYVQAIDYDQEISDNWDDLMTLDSRILALEKAEKHEIIEHARNENVKFTPYNLLQELTHKASHRSFDDTERIRFNWKANELLEKIEIIAAWIPN